MAAVASAPVTLPLSLAWRLLLPLTTGMFRTTHMLASVPLRACVPALIQPAYIAIDTSCTVCAKTLALSAYPVARLLSAVAPSLSVVPRIASVASAPVRAILSPRMSSLATATATAVRTTAYTAVVVMSSPLITYLKASQGVAYVAGVAGCACTAAAGHVLSALTAASKHGIVSPALLSLLLRASFWLPLAAARLTEPLLHPPITLIFALTHAPSALIAELLAHPPTLASLLIPEALNVALAITAIAAKPLCIPLSWPILRTPANVALTFPYACARFVARTAAYTIPSLVARVLICNLLSAFAKTCDVALLPLPRLLWRRALAPVACLALRPLHYTAHELMSCVPRLAGVCAVSLRGTENACAKFVGVPLWCVRTVLCECAAGEVTFEWSQRGRLLKDDPNEVLLITDFNRCVKVLASIYVCMSCM
jgi:hypothetical protein